MAPVVPSAEAAARRCAARAEARWWRPLGRARRPSRRCVVRLPVAPGQNHIGIPMSDLVIRIKKKADGAAAQRHGAGTGARAAARVVRPVGGVAVRRDAGPGLLGAAEAAARRRPLKRRVTPVYGPLPSRLYFSASSLAPLARADALVNR